ncbi:hypothetical protein FPV67DRAFT_1484268 [Lyophyllum atratum]|nr:hypothetical protein FPV67DRAFT_1484268 [Lyophyllum atratum]
MKLDNFSAWICMEGVQQPQYAIKYFPDKRLATCWVASEVGKNFSICWKDSLGSFTSSGRVYVDGTRGDTGTLTHSAKYLNGRTSCIKGFTTSKTTERLFLFSKLDLTDDRYLYTASSHLGEIKLEIQQCRVKGSSTRWKWKKVFPEPGKVHERSKKGMIHGSKLSPETQCKVEFVETVKFGKVATFIFKYRPLAQLQANGIIVVDKKRKRFATADDIIDLTKDDEVVDAQRIKALKEELLILQRKQDKANKRVKIEPAGTSKMEF